MRYFLIVFLLPVLSSAQAQAKYDPLTGALLDALPSLRTVVTGVLALLVGFAVPFWLYRVLLDFIMEYNGYERYAPEKRRYMKVGGRHYRLREGRKS